MARHHLPQNLNVHPALDLNGKATCMFEVPADVVAGVVRNPTNVRCNKVTPKVG
jgi:hypothetical protein